MGRGGWLEAAHATQPRARQATDNDGQEVPRGKNPQGRGAQRKGHKGLPSALPEVGHVPGRLRQG
eukprot:7401483-Prorocentrum_lima.AAC.1